MVSNWIKKDNDWDCSEIASIQVKKKGKKTVSFGISITPKIVSPEKAIKSVNLDCFFSINSLITKTCFLTCLRGKDGKLKNITSMQ